MDFTSELDSVQNSNLTAESHKNSEYSSNDSHVSITLLERTKTERKSMSGVFSGLLIENLESISREMSMSRNTQSSKDVSRGTETSINEE